MQDRVHLVDSRSAEPSVESVLVEALHVRGGKVLQLDPAQSRFDVVLDEVGVSIVCALPDGAAHRALEPHVQVLSHRHVLVAVDDALDAVREHPGELVHSLLARLAIRVCAFRTLHGVYRVTGHPAAILSLRY